jgi:hypothetical protein
MVKSQDPRFTHECGAGDGTSGSKNAEPVPPLIDRRFIGAALTRTKSVTIFSGLLNNLQARFSPATSFAYAGEFITKKPAPSRNLIQHAAQARLRWRGPFAALPPRPPVSVGLPTGSPMSV